MISRKKAIELAQDNNTIYAVKDYIHVDIEGRTKYQRLRKFLSTQVLFFFQLFVIILNIGCIQNISAFYSF